MIKLFRLVIMLGLFSNYIFSQSIDSQVISSGGYFFYNQNMISATIGETVIYDYTQENYDLHQGFQNIALDLICSFDCVLYNHIIELPEGWSFWSTYLSPKEPDMQDIFSEINESVIILKNQHGDVYWPYFGINGISGHVNGQGYQIKVEEDVFLEIEGYMQVNPEVTIYEDWNILGCLYFEPTLIEESMSPIIDNVILVKDENANVFWPFLSINTIQYIVPGEGYAIKLNSDVNFIFENQDDELSRESIVVNEITGSFYYEVPKNTGHNMVIGFPHNILDEYMDYGDEIVVFDNHDNVVGHQVFYDDNLAITVWGDDTFTSKKDGMQEYESFNFRIWNKDLQTENKIEVTQWKQGTGFYIQDGINIADNVILNNVEARCDFKIFPNPVSSELKIEFDIKDQCFTNIFITNNLGKRKSIFKEDLHKGRYNFDFLINEDPGIYYVIIETCNNSFSTPISVIK